MTGGLARHTLLRLQHIIAECRSTLPAPSARPRDPAHQAQLSEVTAYNCALAAIKANERGDGESAQAEARLAELFLTIAQRRREQAAQQAERIERARERGKRSGNNRADDAADRAAEISKAARDLWLDCSPQLSVSARLPQLARKLKAVGIENVPGKTTLHDILVRAGLIPLPKRHKGK